jgi:hypothetical protein
MTMIISPSFFEALMLISFGAAWPVSIYKSYRARTNRGKSSIFLYVLLFGYCNGMIYQYLNLLKINYIFYLFIINSLLISADLILYYRNKRLDNK